MNKTKKKLFLNRERLRTLAARELVEVAGGLIKDVPQTETNPGEVCCCQSTRPECSGMAWC